MKPDTRIATHRQVIERIFDAIPDLRRFHSPQDPLHQMLNCQITDYYKNITGNKPGIGPFRALQWPRIDFGKMDSFMFFCYGEFILYHFYMINLNHYNTFFDIGAHMGLDTIVASLIGYSVDCFEPDPGNFQYLQRNISLNGLENRIRSHNKGVSDRSGRSRFVRVIDNTTASHITGSRAYYGDSDSVEIETTTFDEIGSFPGLMKINVEGHEHVIVPLIPDSAWERMDAFIEIHDEKNRNALHTCFSRMPVNVFSQKKGWEMALEPNDYPSWNTEGYIFVTMKEKMPW
jgi:FkbM family methyltransferase